MKVTPIQQMKSDMFKLEKQAKRWGKCTQIAAAALGITVGFFAADALTNNKGKMMIPSMTYGATMCLESLTGIISALRRKSKIIDYNDVANRYFDAIKQGEEKATIANV